MVRLRVYGGRYGSRDGVTLERCHLVQKVGQDGFRYIGHFKVLARVGQATYRLDLPAELSEIHSTFHFSQLRKCLVDVSVMVSLEDIQLDDHLNYIERLVAILDRKRKPLRNKVGELVKV